MDELFGWEILYRLVEKDIHKKEHVLVLLIHWYLTKNKFRCVGLGDDRTLMDSDARSELLPPGWSSVDSLALRYEHNGELYILHGEYVDGTAIFNLLRVNTLKASNVIFSIDETVSAIRGSLAELLPNYNVDLDNIRRSLIEPVFQGAAREISTQTPAERTQHPPPEYIDPLMVGPPRIPPRYAFGREPLRPDFVHDINAAGRRDMDPLGIGQFPARPGGGSEIFDPFHPGYRGRHSNSQTGLIPGGVGRGAIPPGARFDPFGPVIDPTARPSRDPPPDSDHFPPPDGYDDMFS